MAYYIGKECPVCTAGPIFLRRSSNGKSVFLYCSECDSIWFSPKEFDENVVFFPDHESGWALPGDRGFLKGELARWATRDEVENTVFGGMIAGEYPESDF